jgi:cyclopropane fatty-acyl-phospholipid synthase-like methyltransferase
MPMPLPYRDFYYPLNVFMHILTHEEGGVDYLHYALFENEQERIGAAQEHSTELLLSRLPPPPSRILEVGIGLGTTLLRLTRLGYDAEGITPDEKQIAMVRERYGDEVRARHVAFEALEAE